MELTAVLEATVSNNNAQIEQSTKFLEQAARENLPVFLGALAAELANVGKSAVARMAAGLQLKNYLTAKDPQLRLNRQQQWLSMDINMRVQIKRLVLQALGTETGKPAAPQCIAYIASAELPQGQWPDLINSLVVNVTNVTNPEAVKAASLDTIGYICEEIDAKYLAGQSNEILTAIVQGMRKEEPSINVRRSATKAMLNSLEFTKANFEKESERHYIMQVVCEATQCPDGQVMVAALQNLVKIMGLYYQYMEAYMGPALFAITLEAMKSQTDEIALQGIEFWSTVCDEEQDLAIEAAEASDAGRQPEQNSFHYVKGALQFLVPILLLRLAKQEEFDDEDDWNPCKAAGVCLSLMAGCTEDSIVVHVLPFVKEHLTNDSWQYRDAAIMALGAIMEGPDPGNMTTVITDVGVTEKMIELMNQDESVQVRDSAAWTLGRICEQTPNVVLRENILVNLLVALGGGLDREPRVATNVCWALSSLAEAAYDAVDNNGDDPTTYCLSASYEAIVTKLIQTTDRSDASQSNLRTAAYESLMEIIKYSAQDCYETIQKITVHILDRLIKAVELDSQVTGSDRQQLSDIESLICATMQSLLRKLKAEDIAKLSDNLMQALLMMLSTASGQTGGVQEDALLTISVVVESLGESFFKYMDAFISFLKAALLMVNDMQVCQAAVGLVGDICRALGPKVAPYCNDLMIILVQILSNPEVHRSLKCPILSTIGDIAMAIGGLFKQYMSSVLTILQEASQLQVDKGDYEMVEYLNDLREGCLEAYIGILQALKGEKENEIHPDVQLLWPHVPVILTLIESIGKDDDRSDATVSCSAGLLGDLCMAYSANLIPLLTNKPAIEKLLKEGRLSHNKRAKTLSAWAFKILKGLQPSGVKVKG